MSQMSERAYITDPLVWFVKDMYNFSDEVVDAIPSATAPMQVGQVLQYETPSTTVLVPCTSGSDAVAVLLTPIPLDLLTTTDTVQLVLSAGPAVVDTNKLVIDSGQLASAVAALAVLGIKAVTPPTGVTQTL
jgi:hypothetical protein